MMRHTHFLHTFNQCRTAFRITLVVLANEVNFPMELCEGGHNIEKIVKLTKYPSVVSLVPIFYVQVKLIIYIYIRV